MIRLDIDSGLASIQIAHDNPLNPFTRSMTRELAAVAQTVEDDDSVRGAYIWGGRDRAFSVGGDFSDLRQIASPDEGEAYLRSIVDSYQALLSISKPLVAAIDRHAIGQGLQVALMADWKIGTTRARLQMPELANGMPCPLGSAILEASFGRARMLHWVIGCGELDAEDAQREGFIDAIVSVGELEHATRQALERLCGFPSIAYRLTKRIHNERLHDALERVRAPAARAHAESYFRGQASEHFSRVLGESE